MKFVEEFEGFGGSGDEWGFVVCIRKDCYGDSNRESFLICVCVRDITFDITCSKIWRSVKKEKVLRGMRYLRAVYLSKRYVIAKYQHFINF